MTDTHEKVVVLSEARAATPAAHEPQPVESLPGTADRLTDLLRRLDAAVHAGSARAVARQHAKGKLTARERIDLLADPDSFVELDAFARQPGTGDTDPQVRPYGDGVVTGTATVDGRPICLFAQDFTVYGGSLGEAFGQRVIKVMDLAARIGCPIVGLNDSGGARVQEGVVSLAYYAEIALRNSMFSGVVPQLSLMMGPCAGGAVYSPAMTDFVIMVDRIAHMFVTGPDVLRSVTGQQVTPDDLGGGAVCGEVAGTAHYLAADEQDAIAYTQDLLSYLPSNNLDPPPAYGSPSDLRLTDRDLALDRVVPGSATAAYDMSTVVGAVLDDGELLQVGPRFAPNIICGFGRIDGASVGIVANQPSHLAGVLDINASEKAARFVRFCDAFNIPLVTFVDVPGYLPGPEQERGGIIRRGAKLVYAYAEATVPKITVVVRKAYGGGYAVMGSKHLGADLNLAWPTAEIAVMGAASAVGLLYRQELAAAGADAERLRGRLIHRYQQEIATPYLAAERGYLDMVIRPADTRAQVTRGLRMLRNKRQDRPLRKHGNIPL